MHSLGCHNGTRPVLVGPHFWGDVKTTPRRELRAAPFTFGSDTRMLRK